MIRSELVAKTALYTGVDPETVNKVLRGTTDVIAATLASGEAVTVSGLAKFTGRLERQSPATSTQLHRVVHIAPSSTLAAVVRGDRPPPVVPSLPQDPSAAVPGGARRPAGDSKRTGSAKKPPSNSGAAGGAVRPGTR